MTLAAYPELSVYNSIIKQAANPGAIPKSISNAAVNDNTDVSCYDKKTVKKKIICKSAIKTKRLISSCKAIEL